MMYDDWANKSSVRSSTTNAAVSGDVFIMMLIGRYGNGLKLFTSQVLINMHRDMASM